MTTQNKKTQRKARLLLRLTMEDTKGVQKFFDNNISLEETKTSPQANSPTSPQPRGAVIDFYKFYNESIMGRLRQKLEQSQKKLSPHPPTVPSVTINLDSEDLHPPILTVDQPTNSPPQPANPNTNDHKNDNDNCNDVHPDPDTDPDPPPRLPKRRGAPQNLAELL
jgi:hypothetical protein